MILQSYDGLRGIFILSEKFKSLCELAGAELSFHEQREERGVHGGTGEEM